MEFVEAALKPTLRKEMALQLSPQPVVDHDDICSVHLPNGVVFDDFFVDDLLDFSNKDDVVEQQQLQQQQQQEREKEEQQKKLSLTLCPKQEQDHASLEIFNFDDFGPIPAAELALPADDVANLEWLSHFVEDSFAEYSPPLPAGAIPVKPKDGVAEPETKPVLASTCFKTPVPAKARSKRTRTGVRVWSLGSPSLSDSSSSTTSTASSSSCPSSPWLVSTNPGSMSSLGPAEPVDEKPLKKKFKKKSPPEGNNVINCAPFARRCSHCGVQKTPQWRTGPLGAKTLCNACGVRYKSGRLFPEYRPACSPTFSSKLHSNHHSKVLEMRSKKEAMGRTEPGLAPAVVSSF